MRLTSYLLPFIGCLVAIPAMTTAQGRPEGFSFGLAAVGNNSPYVGGDVSLSLLPILGYDSSVYSVGVLQGLRLTAFQGDNFRLSAIAAPRFYLEIADTEGAALDGIDRNITGEAGFELEYTFGRLTAINLRGVQEVTGEHGGQELVLDVQQTIPLGSFPLTIGADLRWQSADHAEYAWGVKPEEATSSRPAYAPGDVLIPGLQIGTFIPISDYTTLIASLRVDFLPDDVSDSPIIDQVSTTSVFVGITRSF